MIKINKAYKLTILNENLKSSLNFDKNKICPICFSSKYEKSNSNYKNVYSELISNYLDLDEDFLVSFSSCDKCSNCKTYYWGNQISARLRTDLYTKILPIHPKGSDSTGKFFSIKGLKEKIYGIEENNPKKIRIIDGYLSSFKFENDIEIEICKNALKNLNNNQNISALEKFLVEEQKNFLDMLDSEIQF